MTPDLTPAALDELAGKAARATPGPWRWSDEIDDGSWGDSGPNLETVARGPVYADGSQGAEVDIVSAWGYDAWGINVTAPDAAFIAAADPATVAALVDEVKRLRAQIADLSYRATIDALGADS